VKIHEVFSPFPVHGLDQELGYKRTRLPILGMVGTFLIVSGLKPYVWPRQFDLRSTEDKHIMAIDLALNKGKTKDEIAGILKGAGASEVNEKNFD
jgi:hypothetical protein